MSLSILRVNVAFEIQYCKLIKINFVIKAHLIDYLNDSGRLGCQKKIIRTFLHTCFLLPRNFEAYFLICSH